MECCRNTPAGHHWICNLAACYRRCAENGYEMEPHLRLVVCGGKGANCPDKLIEAIQRASKLFDFVSLSPDRALPKQY